jgi:hypothetical protein
MRDPEADDLATLRAENTELRHRVEAAEQALDELRTEALARRAEVRAMAESLPSALSRRSVLRAMVSDALHHPDKAGVMKRAVRKVGRIPRKLARTVLRRT